MKVVLDTNVVVSGTFWTGASFKVVSLIDKEKIIMIVTLPILREYEKVVHSEEILEKTTIFQQAKINVLYKILARAIIVEPKEKIDIIKDDLDDNKFLEAAVESQADYIISRDKKHLLILKNFRGISIVTPEEFLDLIKK